MTDREMLLIVYGWLKAKAESAKYDNDTKELLTEVGVQLFPLQMLVAEKKENDE